MPIVQASDFEVAYRLEGDPSAPVVTLAHGVMTSHRMWDEVALLLEPRWRVLRYDLRGHGRTTVTAGPYTLSQLADDVVLLLDALGLGRTHFIGSSLGGMVGQQVGARHGGRLLTLTLANTTAVQEAPGVWTDRIATAEAEGMAPLVEPTLRRWFTEAFLGSRSAIVEEMRRLAAATPVTGFVAAASAILDLDQAAILSRIATPTLIVAGRQDQATPLAQSTFLQSRIAGSHLALLPAAHQAAAEQPAAFVRLWERFVDAADLPRSACGQSGHVVHWHTFPMEETR